MKKITKLLAIVFVFFAFSAASFAGSKAEVEQYAHPTFFGDETHIYVKDNKNYVVGNGKHCKTKKGLKVKDKEYVYVNSFAKDVLDIMRTGYHGTDIFNPKMPVLRSELAVALTEGLNVKDVVKNAKRYTDVAQGYWAKSWIDNAYEANLMIGYPDDSFRPDQPVTKAEVFAVIAQMVDVPVDKSLKAPLYKGKEVRHIPAWAIAPSKEVVNSKLLEKLPDQSKIVDSEYLSKEQVAYLVGALRNDFGYYKNLAKDKNAPECVKNYAPVYIGIKLADRISARTSNIGDKFTAKTTKEVRVGNVIFPAESKVIGEVVEVDRPGIGNCGYIKVKFLEIKCGNDCVKFPKQLNDAQMEKIKNPNFLARLFGFPFSGTGRVVGVVGRTVGTSVNVIGNGLEEIGDEISNGFVETLSLQPVAGLKSFGSTFVTFGLGIYDLGKLLVSGLFGVLYEITDEVKYIILPCASNDSSLNPGEEMLIIF